jgi:hypothetical protein
MKKYYLLLSILCFSFIGFSQNAVIVFEKSTHDFGTIKEEDGKVTCVFNFTNKGTSPLVIRRVQASCGCTTPDWTKEPIEPGKKGSISVVYTTAGRPGPFTKTITVNSNATEAQQTLSIKGNVIGKMVNASADYPINMGGVLGLKSRVIHFEQIYKGHTASKSLKIQNTGNRDLKINIEGLPAYITATVNPSVLKPKEEGTITVNYNTNKTSQWGLNNEAVFVGLNGDKKAAEEFKLSVVSNIIEDFRNLTPDQKRKAPIMEVANQTINLGTLTAGATKTVRFHISNKGLSPLHIRRIINNNQDLWIHQSKMTIESGRKGSIGIDVITKKQTPGNYKRTISIQTNDPDHVYYILVLNWEIKK